MKKRAISILSLVLCVLLSSILVSCSETDKLLRMDEPERADAFFDIVNKAPADSYCLETDISIKGSLYGTAFEVNADSSTTYVGKEASDLVYHTEATTTVTVGKAGSAVTETEKKNMGYRDGKLYEMLEKDGEKNLLCSSLSAEDFKEHQEFLVGYSDAELADIHKRAANKTCVQNENGTWCATFSEYAEADLLAIIDYGFDYTVHLLDGYRVKDVIVTVEADSELLPTEWKYELVFEKLPGDAEYSEPEACTSIEFEDIGSAVAPEIDLSAYKEVEALADLQKIKSILSKKTTADCASFTAKSSQKVTYDSTNQYTEETDKVTVKTENGKYTFDIDARIVSPAFLGGTNATVSYKDGVYTMQGSKISEVTQEMSVSEAKLYIAKLIDPASLSSVAISDILLRTDGHTHLFTIASPDYSALEASLASLGAGNIKAEASVGVDYEDGRLTGYEYTMTVTARINGRTMTILVSSEVTFNE